MLIKPKSTASAMLGENSHSHILSSHIRSFFTGTPYLVYNDASYSFSKSKSIIDQLVDAALGSYTSNVLLLVGLPICC